MKMKAVVSHGNVVDGLSRVEERDVPSVRPGHSLLRIKAATINQLSNTIRKGGMDGTPFPLVLGNEGAGIVEAGAKFPPGTAVVVYGAGILGVVRDGLLRQWAVVEDSRLFALPAGLSLDQGAAASVNYITAYQALTRVAGVKPGQKVLVSGGTGALGHALREVAESFGAEVTVVVSTSEKAARARELGAASIIDLSQGSLYETARALIDAAGYDLALDSVGGPMTSELIRAVRRRGTVVSIGFAAGTRADIDLVDIIVNEKRLVGYDLHLEDDRAVENAFRHISTLMEKGVVRPVIDSRYHLDDVEAAYARLASRKSVGVIVLQL